MANDLDIELLEEYAPRFAVAVGAFLASGYVLGKVAEWANEHDKLHATPQFQDVRKLKEHLQQFSGEEVNVLVEGKVEKLDNNSLESAHCVGIEGAVRTSSTETFEKVYNSRRFFPWDHSSRITDNFQDSVPFSLVLSEPDPEGSHIRVEGLHTAKYFRYLVSEVYMQKKTLPGHFTTEPDVQNNPAVPTGTLVREGILAFGSGTLAIHGSAVLRDSSLGHEEITLTPLEVGPSINSILIRNEANNPYHTIPWVLSGFCYTGGILLGLNVFGRLLCSKGYILLLNFVRQRLHLKS